MKAWKLLGLALVGYSLYAGLMFEVPRLVILNETIRNLYFHVPMWFTMIALLGGSLAYSIRLLRSGDAGQALDLDRDRQAKNFAEVAMVFALLGLFTGMVWAKATWGAYWTADPKLNGTAVNCSFTQPTLCCAAAWTIRKRKHAWERCTTSSPLS